MARPPKGKPLTLRAIRLDDDVWAECQRLGKEHGTINEGLRMKMLDREVKECEVCDVRLKADYPFSVCAPCCDELRAALADSKVTRVLRKPDCQAEVRHARRIMRQTRRGPREKGDKTR